MLSAKALKTVKQASHYFFEQDNYYLNDAPELKASAGWWGKGASRLGLIGEVTKAQFNDLLQGKLPHGQQLGKRVDNNIKHRPGFDLTFSAPKSISILAEIGRDTRLHQAHTEAVQEALIYVEQLCASARKTTRGNTTFEKTENLTVATFLHDTSRSLDPHLHTHCVVLNMTQREDGHWRALASDKKQNQGFLEQVFENQRFIGAIYRAALAYKVQKLGYTVEKTHSDGRFEVGEVPKTVNQHFSRRREDIEQFLTKRGMQGARASSYATLETRQSKQQIDRKELHQQWHERAASLDFNAQTIISQSFTQDTVSQPVTDDVAQEAVRFAIDHLSERDTYLSHHKLLNIAATHAIGTTTPSNIIKAIHQAVKDSELIVLPSHDETIRYTTKTLLGFEQEMLQHVSAQAYSAMPIASRKVLTQQASESPLTKDQQAAFVDVLDAPHKMVAINGISGSGKSNYLIPHLCKTTEKLGWNAIVLTPTKAAAKQHEKQNLTNQSVSAFIAASQKTGTLKKTFLMVDDASMLSAKQIRDLQHIAQRSDNRLILVGDNKAYLPMAGGSPFEQLQKAGVKTVSLTQIMRQQDKTHLAAIEDAFLGDIQAAFSKMRSQILAIDDKDDRINSMAQHYVHLPERDKALLLLPSRNQCDVANHAVRHLLKAKGELGEQQIQVTTLVPKSLTTTETTSARHYLTGEVVRFNQAQKKYNIKAQHYYTVVGTDTSRNDVILQDDNGKTFAWKPLFGKRQGAIEVFTPKPLDVNQGDVIRFSRNQSDMYKGEKAIIIGISQDKVVVQRHNGEHTTLDLKIPSHRHFEYGYAVTPYQSYYEAPDHVIAHQESQTPLTTQRSFYKQLSQASASVWLYTDDTNAYLETVQKQTGNRLGAIDHVLKDNRIVFDPAHPPQARVEQFISAIRKVIADTDLSPFLDKQDATDIAKDATLYAMHHLAEREAAFTHQDLLQTALVHALGKTTPQHIALAIQKLAETEAVLNKDAVWTTREAIQLEQTIIQMNQEGQGKLEPIATQAQLDETLAKTTLTAGQKEAVRLITGTFDNTVLVQGYAGTGKTTMLNAAQPLLAKKAKADMLEVVKTVCQQHDYTLHGLAPSHTAVQELYDRGIKAQTLDSFLVEIQSETTSENASRTVFVLDEASMVSNRKYHDILAFCLEQRAKLVSLGDTEQLASPESGKPFALSQMIGTKTAYMTEIKRQQGNPTLLNAVHAIYKKELPSAFKLLETHKYDAQLSIKPTETSPLAIIEIENKEARLVKLAEDYLSRSIERRQSTLIITPANQDRVVVNELVRDGLKKEGLLTGNEVGIHILVACNMTRIERTRTTNYQHQQVIRFNRAIHDLGIAKNSYYTVNAIDVAQNVLTLTNNQGQQVLLQPHRIKNEFEVYDKEERNLCIGDEVRFTRSEKAKKRYAGTQAKVVHIDDNKTVTLAFLSEENRTETFNLQLPENQHLEHGFAMTTHMSQGKTKTEVIALQDSTYKHLTTQRNFLVAVTRAALTVTLYTDNKSNLLTQIQKATGEKTSALEAMNLIDQYLPAKSLQKSQKHLSSNTSATLEKPHYDINEIQARLTESTETVVENLLGKPNKITATTYRYGRQKGSLVITLKGEKRGYWYDVNGN